MGLDDAVAELLAAVSRPGVDAPGGRRAAAGRRPGVDGFATATELGAALAKVPQRGIQLPRSCRPIGPHRSRTAALLDAIIDIARGVIADFGGVAAVRTLTAEIRAQLPQVVSASTDPAVGERAERTAGGLLRVALDRLSEHETADNEIEFVRRRHGRRLALLATDEALLSGC